MAAIQSRGIEIELKTEQILVFESFMCQVIQNILMKMVLCQRDHS